jgi:hypothetical protein
MRVVLHASISERKKKRLNPAIRPPKCPLRVREPKMMSSFLSWLRSPKEKEERIIRCTVMWEILTGG